MPITKSYLSWLRSSSTSRLLYSPFGLRVRESRVELSWFGPKLAYFSQLYSTLLHSPSFPPQSKQALNASTSPNFLDKCPHLNYRSITKTKQSSLYCIKHNKIIFYLFLFGNPWCPQSVSPSFSLVSWCSSFIPLILNNIFVICILWSYIIVPLI